jgi:hypothetical protein
MTGRCQGALQRKVTQGDGLAMRIQNETNFIAGLGANRNVSQLHLLFDTHMQTQHA